MRFVITIRFTNPQDIRSQIKDLDVVSSNEIDESTFNTSWLRNAIRSKVPECSTRRLRLIYGGKVLNENSNLKSELIVPFVRQQQLQQQQQSQAEIANAPPSKLFIHCLIGDTLTPSQLSEESRLDTTVQRTTAPEVVGFDRLLLQGFTQDDVRDLRRQFQTIYTPEELQSGSSGVDIQDLEEEERRQAHIRQLEERWIESTVTPASVDQGATGIGSRAGGGPVRPLNSGGTDNQSIAGVGGSAGEGGVAGNGTDAAALELEENSGNEDLLLGLLVGVFLGVLSLIFLAVDDTVFNKRQKMSIIAGIFINCSFAIVRGQWV
ncbi:DSC E3 ubiquitin ligase complex subunit 3 [[Candida] railenensis]|uniref:DSC E3 ubiquitin ligase complex subunit 3 n=1 Tax=[Candida] railenensis TaxID=45579 RepID=A0A9P0QSK0_9ASCO|nr:DSC E3 ubiquitin ligase complex subunit 3 [[Candida] railenensis]